MIHDISNYCLRFSRSQGMSDLRESRGNYDIMLILRGFASSIWSYVATQRVIRMPPDGILILEFHTNVD